MTAKDPRVLRRAVRKWGALAGQHTQARRPALESRWAEVGGWRIHSRASAPPPDDPAPDVVLVHGIGVSSRYWVPSAVLLAPYAQVHAVDLPGFGLSDKPAEPLTLPDLADVLAAWTETTGLIRPVVMGNSFGCQVTVELATRHPDLVRATVLVGPTIDPHARTAARQVGRWLIDGSREPPSQVVVILRDYIDCGMRRLRKTFEYALNDRIEEKLPRLAAPTLVVRGGRDPIVPEAWSEEVAALLPRGRLVVVPGAGHTVNYNAPLELVRVVRPFLQQLLAG